LVDPSKTVHKEPDGEVEVDHDEIDFDEHHQEMYSHLTDDGMLKIVDWAEDLGQHSDKGGQVLHVPDERGDHDLAHSNAHGDGLVSNGNLGVDLIRADAGEGFVPHTHPGDHILITVYGKGTITYDGHVYPTEPGQVYIIEGEVAHGVGARTDHGILAVGAPHAPVDSDSRMTPTEYDEVTQELDSVECLICDVQADHPDKLHDKGCEHCPCYECISDIEKSDLEEHIDE
jgi:quercetin dioxygenase-like cupin family protein